MSGKMESAAPRNVENGFPRPAGSEFPPAAPDFVVPVHTPPQGGMAGLQSLCAACQRLYPEQPNPLQVTARLKYWLGGPDPLDYISMYWNPGQPELRVPPHWHYISFGLSDLHGDGRVHPRPAGPPSPERPSGLGMELTMRVAGEEGGAPTWPAALLQRLARYIFTTGNCLCVGDHVSWHSPLDGGPVGAIRHMLVGADPCLSTTLTPLGKVDYVQVVGVTDSELRSAQRCGGAPLLAALADLQSCGPWLVTDMQRIQSAELSADPQGPSDLSGVAASCRWEPLPPATPPVPERDSSEIPQTVKEEIKCVLQRGLSDIISKSTSQEDTPADECKMSTDSTKLFSESSKKLHINDSVAKSLAADKDISMSTDSFKMTDMENALLEEVMQLPPKAVVAGEGDLTRVHLFFDKEAASLLPLALRGRVVHGAHFTWTAVGGAQAITLLGPGVGGALASATKPIAALNGWLQVFLPSSLAVEMAEQLAGLEGAAVEGEVASHYEWPEHGLAITVLDTFS